MSLEIGVQRKTRYHHGDLRAQLLEAARQLVETVGPDHFSMAEACREAGVSVAAPYRHFKDRESMLAAVTAEGMKRHYVAMQQGLEGIESGTRDRVRALGCAYVEFAMAEPGVFRLLFSGRFDRADLERIIGEPVPTYEILLTEVASALGRNAVDHDVERRAFMLWTFVHGMAFLLIDNVPAQTGSSMDLPTLLDEMGDRVLPEARQASP